jgi:hypothetical protein
MTVLPNDPGAVVIGCLLRDPGQGPWGGAPQRTSLPRLCTNCGGTGWTNDPYFGGTIGVRCPACGGV